MENNRVQDSGGRGQLRPCPFCGGGPVLDYYTVGVWDESEDRWNVTCDTCGITFEEGFNTRKEAVEAWNRRTVALRLSHVDGAGFGLIGHCHDCGTAVMSNTWKFCPECGATLEWGE